MLVDDEIRLRNYAISRALQDALKRIKDLEAALHVLADHSAHPQWGFPDYNKAARDALNHKAGNATS